MDLSTSERLLIFHPQNFLKLLAYVGLEVKNQNLFLTLEIVLDH